MINNDRNKTVKSTLSDLKADVKIGKVGNGYFSSEKNASIFFDYGLSDTVNKLPDNVRFADFGGGEGFLAYMIKKLLEQRGKKVIATVVDANYKYLEEAKTYALNTLSDDIASCSLQDQDFIIMRSVNHYNSLEEQYKILKNCHRSLKSNAFIISQILSGTEQDCKLMSALLNHPLLGRAQTPNQFHVTSKNAFTSMLQETGFTKIQIAGYAPSVNWGPHILWERYHKAEMDLAISNNDIHQAKEINAQKQLFLKDCVELITKHIKKYTKETHFFQDNNANFLIDLLFPIFRCARN